MGSTLSRGRETTARQAELKSWQARPDQPLAFIQEKWEASSEVLVNDGRQVGHDEEEDRD